MFDFLQGELFQDAVGQFVTLLVQAFIAVVLPMFLVWLQRQLASLKLEYERRVSSDARYYLEEAVRLAVRAAEQSGLKGLIENEAMEKKQYAMQVAEAYLKNVLGFDVDLAVIDAAIERAILENWHKGPGGGYDLHSAGF